MKVVSPKEMARIEQLAYASGCKEESFMDAAGAAVASAIEQLPGKPKLTFLIGCGNNGGDGYVAAKILDKAGYDVTLHVAEPKSALCKKKRWGKTHPLEEATFDEGIIIDALFGTGFHGTPNGPYKSVIDKATRSELPIFAIDIASPGIVATETLCLGLPKTVIFERWEEAGILSVHDFGLPQEFIDQAEEEATLIEKVALPPLKRTQHKYEAGYVVAVAGSPGMPGAAILSAFAALRAGAGIVRLFHPKGMEAELVSAPPEIIRCGFTDSAPIFEALKKASALFIGPGFGLERVELLKELLAATVPMVIDAEALTLIAKHQLSIQPKSILTPHTGEMKRLLSEGQSVQQFADEHDVYVVLKGAPTQIFVPNQKRFIMARGDPGMATAGSGDVLTGVIAALLAHMHEPLLAAQMGVYLHAVAGEIAAELNSSYCVVASDITEALPDAYLLCH